MRPKGSAHRTSRIMTMRDAHQAGSPALKVQALACRLGAMATDDFFLPGQATPVQINRIGKAVVEPPESVYDGAPAHR